MLATFSAARGGVIVTVAMCLFVLSGPAVAQPATTPKPEPTKPAAPKPTAPAASKPAPAASKPAAAPAKPAAAPAKPAAAPAKPAAAPAEPLPPAAPPIAPATRPEDVPVNLRLRRLEQQVQALKERAWRSKARVGMLKEAVLGGGIGARATIQHINKMGSSYRLVQLVYALDGTTIFSRTEESGAMHETKAFDILSGPITPGSHTLSVLALYRGHGYGVFKYLSKYKFTVRSSHTFTATEGKGTTIKVIGYERGGATTPLEQRPAIDFQVSHAGS